jgi:hypothetical protein
MTTHARRAYVLDDSSASDDENEPSNQIKASEQYEKHGMLAQAMRCTPLSRIMAQAKALATSSGKTHPHAWFASASNMWMYFRCTGT